jgi:hypothetical protein
MNHPFSSVDPKYRWLALGLLLIATVTGLAALSIQGKRLQTPAAPYGGLSLQLAWSKEKAGNIIQSWEEVKSVAYSQHYYDFIFLIIYPLFFSFSIVILSDYVSGPVSMIGAALSWIVLVAMPLDAIENMLILRMLDTSQPALSQLTTVLAALKWTLVLSALGYWFAALLELLSRFWAR